MQLELARETEGSATLWREQPGKLQGRRVSKTQPQRDQFKQLTQNMKRPETLILEGFWGHYEVLWPHHHHHSKRAVVSGWSLILLCSDLWDKLSGSP